MKTVGAVIYSDEEDTSLVTHTQLYTVDLPRRSSRCVESDPDLHRRIFWGAQTGSKMFLRQAGGRKPCKLHTERPYPRQELHPRPSCGVRRED